MSDDELIPIHGLGQFVKTICRSVLEKQNRDLVPHDIYSIFKVHLAKKLAERESCEKGKAAQEKANEYANVKQRLDRKEITSKPAVVQQGTLSRDKGVQLKEDLVQGTLTRDQAVQLKEDVESLLETASKMKILIESSLLKATKKSEIDLLFEEVTQLRDWIDKALLKARDLAELQSYLATATSQKNLLLEKQKRILLDQGSTLAGLPGTSKQLSAKLTALKNQSEELRKRIGHGRAIDEPIFERLETLNAILNSIMDTAVEAKNVPVGFAYESPDKISKRNKPRYDHPLSEDFQNTMTHNPNDQTSPPSPPGESSRSRANEPRDVLVPYSEGSREALIPNPGDEFLQGIFPTNILQGIFTFPFGLPRLIDVRPGTARRNGEEVNNPIIPQLLPDSNEQMGESTVHTQSFIHEHLDKMERILMGQVPISDDPEHGFYLVVTFAVGIIASYKIVKKVLGTGPNQSWI